MISKKIKNINTHMQNYIFNEQIDSLFAEFISHCQMEGLTKITINNYERYFYQFVKQMRLTTLGSITTDIIETYKKQLLEQGIKRRSINQYLTIIGIFLKWIERYKDIQLGTKIYKLSTKTDKPIERKILTEEQILRLCSINPKASFTEYRDSIACNILLNTGCRRSSLVNLKVRDIDIIKQELTFTHMKSGKPHTVPVNKEILNILINYINRFELEDDDYIYSTVYGQQFSGVTLYQALNGYYNKRGFPNLKGIHIFRYTCITKLLEKGFSTYSIAKFVGHKDSSMVEKIYAQYNPDHVKDLAEVNLITIDKTKKRRRF